MDVVAIIKELREELERIDNLILALDSLRAGKRRGRPPKLLQELRAARSSQADVAPAPRKRATRKGRKAGKKKTGAAASA